MKRVLRLFAVFFVALMVSGCVKIDMSMNINKDKSMNLEITEAVSSKLLESSDDSAFNEKNIEDLKKEGYTVKKYNKDNMVGYTVSKNFSNIDEFSSTKDVVGDLSVNDKSKNKKYLFKVTKGFLKNKYKAVFTSTDTNSVKENMDSTSTETSAQGNVDNTTDATSETNNNFTINVNESDLKTVDYSSSLNSMEMNFKVKLPYKAISSNATEVTDNDKTLSWNLLKLNNKNIEFEFELYNMTNVYILIGGGVFVLIVLIVVIIKIKKNKKTKNKSNMDGNMSETPNKEQEKDLNKQSSVTPVEPVSAPEATPVEPVSAPEAAPVEPAATPVATPVAVPEAAPVEPAATPEVTPVEPVATPEATPVEPVATPEATPVEPAAAPEATPVEPVATPEATPVEPVTTPEATPVEPAATPEATPTTNVTDETSGNFESLNNQNTVENNQKNGNS